VKKLGKWSDPEGNASVAFKATSAQETAGFAEIYVDFGGARRIKLLSLNAWNQATRWCPVSVGYFDGRGNKYQLVAGLQTPYSGGALWTGELDIMVTKLFFRYLHLSADDGLRYSYQFKSWLK